MPRSRKGIHDVRQVQKDVELHLKDVKYTQTEIIAKAAEGAAARLRGDERGRLRRRAQHVVELDRELRRLGNGLSAWSSGWPPWKPSSGRSTGRTYQPSAARREPVALDCCEAPWATNRGPPRAFVQRIWPGHEPSLGLTGH